MWCVAPIALAEDQSYEIQYLMLDASTRGANYQPNALLYKHILPYNKLIDFEGIVALGINEDTEQRKTGIAGYYSQKFKLSNLLGLMVNVHGAIEPRVHGYLHFGIARVDYDLSTPSWVADADGSQNETGLAYGLGITFKLLSKGAFVLEFTQLPDVETNIGTFDSLFIGLGYQMPLK